MFGVLAIKGCCIGILPRDLDELPRSRILLMLKADGELSKFVVFFVFSILPFFLCSCLYLMFH